MPSKSPRTNSRRNYLLRSLQLSTRNDLLPISYLLLLAIEVLVEVPAKVARGIVEAHLLVEPVNLLDILGLELEVTFQILLDAVLSLGLGNYTAACIIVSNEVLLRFETHDLPCAMPHARAT